jgi:hypothetical protein
VSGDPRVEYRSAAGTRTYVASGARLESIGALPVFEMQCVDCHNRAAHFFETPDRAIDDAIAPGEIPSGLPFVKKTGLSLLKASSSRSAEADQKIPLLYPASTRSNCRKWRRSVRRIYALQDNRSILHTATTSSPISR